MDTNLTMSMKAYTEIFGREGLSEEDLVAEYQEARCWWEHTKWRYFLIQRLIGLLILVLSITVVPLADGDATHLLLLGPLSIYCIFTKKYIIMNEFMDLDQVMDPSKYQ